MASPEVFVGLSGVRSLCNELKRPGNRFQRASKTVRVYLVDRNYQFFDPSQEDEAISSVLWTINNCDDRNQSLCIKTLEIPSEIYERLGHRFPPDQLESFFRQQELRGDRSADTQWMRYVLTSAKPGSGSRAHLRIQFVGLYGLRHRDPFSSMKILGVLHSFKYLWFDTISISEDVDPHQVQPWSKAEGAFTNLQVSMRRDISLKLPKALFCRLETLSIVWSGEASVEMGSSSTFFETLLELPRLKSLSMKGADANILSTFLVSFDRNPTMSLDTLSLGLVGNVGSSLEVLAKNSTLCKMLSSLSLDLRTGYGYDIANIPPMIDSLKNLRLFKTSWYDPDYECGAIPECIFRYLDSESAASITSIDLVGIAIGTNVMNAVSRLPLQELFLSGCSFEPGALRVFGEAGSLQRGLRSLTLRHHVDEATLMELAQHARRFSSLKEIDIHIKRLSKNVLAAICRVIQESQSIVDLCLDHDNFSPLDFQGDSQEVRRVFYKYLSTEGESENEECRRLSNHFATLIAYSLQINKTLSAQRLKKVDSLLSPNTCDISFGLPNLLERLETKHPGDAVYHLLQQKPSLLSVHYHSSSEEKGPQRKARKMILHSSPTRRSKRLRPS